MGPVARAKLTVKLIHGLIGIILLGLVGVIFWLLSLWMVAHPISFFPIVGVLVFCLSVWGLITLYDKAQATIATAAYEEKVARYEKRFGQKPRRDPYAGYLFNIDPDGMRVDWEEENV